MDSDAVIRRQPHVPVPQPDVSRVAPQLRLREKYERCFESVRRVHGYYRLLAGITLREPWAPRL